MASPLRSSDRSSSGRRSTPIRNLPNGDQRVNGYHRPHRESFSDSPTCQLLEEFGRMLINDDRAFKRSLDERTASQQRLHIEALDRALAKHEEVRESAERARERVELEIERERRRREEDEKKAIEKARRDLEEQKLEERRRQIEDAKVREEERRKQEALKKEQEELRLNVEAQKRREVEDNRRQSEVRRQQEAEQLRRSTQESAERAEAARRASENKEGQQRAMQNGGQAAAQQPSASAVQPDGVSSSTRQAPPAAQMPAAATQLLDGAHDLSRGLISRTEERDAIHKRYLDLHQRLKQMRQRVSDEVKKVSGLKDQLSEWRRAIKKCVGQFQKGGSDATKKHNRQVVGAANNITHRMFGLLT